MTTEEEKLLETLLDSVRDAVTIETAKYGIFNTTHEAYGILLEEVDELWEEIKKKRRDRNMQNMHEEALQIASIAVRFALDMKRKDYTAEPE